ncbi:iron-containing redox enzyme family protein [Streptomyces sp. NPDC102451]|uniref:iron-containing redox enzyme family protein n=1 Tax=Streptomyces sp. NPDC102451 TaxID=3366177 RepID=UPI0037F6F9ED
MRENTSHAQANPPPGHSARELYPLACDPECSVADTVPVTDLRAGTTGLPGTETGPDSLESLRAQVRAWADAERDRFTELAGGAPDPGTLRRLTDRTLLQCAPLALMSGAWLAGATSMATADEPAALAALSLYASDVGVGRPHRSRGDAFAALLRAQDAAEYAQPPARTALDRRIGDSAFALPSVLLLMGRLPEDFRAETLGADLCLREAGLLPPLALVRAVAGEQAADWAALDPGAERALDPAGGLSGAESAVAALAGAGAGAEATAGRVRAGFRWAYARLRAWSEEVRQTAGAMADPAWQAAEVIRLRAREGAVYHQSFQLAGRSLADWLEDARTDPMPLLGALAASRLVRPGRPDRSPLVTGLVGERGAMFRVFAEHDLAVLRQWIAGLPERAADTAEAPEGPGSAPAPTRTATDTPGRPETGRPETGGLGFPVPGKGAVGPAGDRPPADLREAYVLLQRRAQTPAVREWALAYVHGWLGRARHRIDRSGLPLPGAWPAEGLRPWLGAQHDRHAAEFTRSQESEEPGLPTREQLIESTVQLAPLTMIDGGWLQGFTDYRLASSQVGFSLFETYWDELGNGQTSLNHPLIYRELVAGMGVELPPTGTEDFARWSGFEDSSFELPVHWLSIGRFPVTFEPEILGLNLAMELSGVGGTYRRARLGLRKHGFSTRFVDIHNTIDNVATGHSAWAADAIDSHLSALPSHGPHRADAWRRIREGYRSLNPPRSFPAWLADRRARMTHRPR